MTLNKNHIAILRRLALGTPGTVYGLSKGLTLENALVSNLCQQLADVKLLRKAENDLLKITDAGQRVLQCIAKNESYDHLLPAEPCTAESSAEDINSLCAAKQPTSQAPQAADSELMQRVLRVLFKASKSIGISKTAEQVNANHIVTKAALDQLAEQGLVKKYSGGSYYINANGRNLVLQVSTPAAQAVAQVPETETVEAQATDQADDTTDIDEALADLQQRGLITQQGERFTLAESAMLTGFNLDQMAGEFEQEQSSQDHPVIDDISAKERALSYCSLLLSPDSKELKRCIDALQVDLAVIRLHQERRA
jgi:predicted transcriptional regulator